MNKYFAICPRGLEELLADELRSIGGEEFNVVDGGVVVAGDGSACYRANRESRRIGNRRLKNALTRKVAFPTVLHGLASAWRNTCAW